MTHIQRDGIGRREFIMLASGTAVAAIAFGDQFLSAAPAAAGADTPITFSLGYSDLRSADGGGKVRVSSADTVTSSDGSLINTGANVRIIGANVAKSSQRQQIYLDVMFPASVNGERKLVPFHAWSYDRGGASGSPVTFLVALDMTQRISMTLGVKSALSQGVSRRDILAGSAAASGEAPVVLSLMSEGGVTKLRRGYYFIAPRVAGESEPAWSAYQFRPEADHKLYNGDTPADFDYVVVRVDAAPLEEATKPDRAPKRP